LNEDISDPLDEHLAKARSGDRAALAALVGAHQRSVYSLALRMLGTRDLAEDLTQDVFMQLHDNLQGIQSNRHLIFWLRQVTSNRAIDQLRHRARVVVTTLDEEMPMFSEQEAPDPMLQRRLRTLLRELSPTARAVLLLRFQEDLDPADIAETLAMPLNTVKSHLKRALDSLREKTSGPQSLLFEGHTP
jgi:RNA polymerase sigma-70 factor (ECF subfamily)